MEQVLSPEGSLALAVAALVAVLGWRFTLPERGRDLAAVLVFVAAVAVTFAAGRGLVPGGGPVAAALPVRVVGAALLVAGLLLAGSSFKARLLAGRGHLAESGPYARLRHPLYAGLALVLVGHLLRLPSRAGALAVTIALAQYLWLGGVEEREARAAFGEAWDRYASRTRALLPRPRRARP
ncbi:methyltransferase family protein [Anaeromyxobacter oryzisoli]|uniref:methyltransferase family protein n=1 Tax=Anaeromyxobacter oryzisoli TaxID=2925408 RepID=UPI001F5826BC|nr:methyltransferase [Anaeromyxobacter sp. SG63]